MTRRRKIISGVAVLTVLLLGAGGTLFFLDEPLEPDRVSHDALAQMESAVFDPPPKEVPDPAASEKESTPAALEGPVAGTPDPGSAQEDPAVEVETPPVTGDPPPTDGGEVQERVDVAALKAAYDGKFLTLQGVAQESLDEILQAMKEEYLALDPEDREDEIVKARLITRYTKAALDLEKRVDDLFYFMLEELETRLGGAEEAATLLQAFESQYKEEKSAQREAVMARVLK